MNKYVIIVTGGLFGIMLAGFAVQAEDASALSEQTITIKDHKFVPDVIELAKGQELRLTVENQDPTPEEFESHELKREKVIAGNSKAVIKIGPLEPGTYPFFGEFNEATAKGQIVVK